MALVKYSGKNVYRSEGLKFLPGINEPGDDALRAAGRNHLLVARFRRRELTFVDGRTWEQFMGEASPTVVAAAEGGSPAGGSGGDGGSELSKLKPAAAKALIKETVDSDLLAKWAAEDNRKDVQAAITERLVELDPATK